MKGCLNETNEEAPTLVHARVQIFSISFVHFMKRELLETSKNETALNVNLLKANSKSIR
jgi:hypothetical protein